MIGKKLKNYRLLQNIGEGGMSTVYLGKDIDSGSLVAIKVLKKAYTQDQDHLKRFFTREIETTRNLSHPNIVKLLDFGRKDSTYFLIYEYVQGVNLDKYILNQKILSIETIESITLQLLSALSHAHSENIVHRDIKPQNILVTQNGKIKVLDFGIAKALSSTTITQTGMFMGSPGYISPEQAEGLKIDGRSDLYSLGVLLFEMLAKRLPFKADTPAGLVYKHVYEIPPDIHKITNNIPSYLSYIVAKCLQKNPSDRFSSAEKIIKVIKSKSYSEDTIIKSPKTKKPIEKKGLSRAKIVAIALGSVAAVAIITVSIALSLNYNSRRQIAESEANGTSPEEVVEEYAEEVEPPPPEGTEEPPESDSVNYNSSEVGAVITGEIPSTLYVDTDNYINIEVKNTSDFIWKATGVNKVTIGYHYYGQDVDYFDYDSTNRTELTRDLNPGDSVSLKMLINDISSEGTYVIQIDPVLEGYYWFSSKDVPLLEGEVLFVAKGEAPTISLQVYEGPTYSEADGVCYYRVKAEVTGDPIPEIKWSRDDSGSAWGIGKTQINLSSGESYTLTATATNSEGAVTDSIELDWSCDGVQSRNVTSNSEQQIENDDIYYSTIGDSIFNLFNFSYQFDNNGKWWNYKISLSYKPTQNHREEETWGFDYVSNFSYEQTKSFQLYAIFENISPNSKIEFVEYLDGNYFDSEIFYNKDVVTVPFAPEFKITKPGIYKIEAFYNGIKVGIATTVILE